MISSKFSATLKRSLGLTLLCQREENRLSVVEFVVRAIPIYRDMALRGYATLLMVTQPGDHTSIEGHLAEVRTWQPEDPTVIQSLAEALATCPDPQLRDPDRAAELLASLAPAK